MQLRYLCPKYNEELPMHPVFSDDFDFGDEEDFSFEFEADDENETEN